MGLIFNGKPVTAVKLCTKAGNSPYNKGGQAAWVETDRIVGLYDYRDAKLVVLRPVIDKLVFEYSFQDFKKKTHTDDLREAVLKNLKKVMAQKKPPFTPLTVEDVGYKRYKELSRTHTAYINSDGSYVVRNDKTGDLVQVSDRNDPNWKSPF